MPNKKEPQERPNEALKKPGRAPKTKSAAREARLAEALRQNLRRRKAGGASEDEKDA